MNPWGQEIRRLTAFLAAALVIGLIVDAVAWALVAGLGLFLLSEARQALRLRRWLQQGSKREPPQLPGLWGDLVDHIYRLARLERKRKKKLGKVLGRFYDSLAAMPDAVITLDQDFRIEWFNPAAAELLGLKKIDRGRPITNLLRDPRFGECLLSGGMHAQSCELRSPLDDRLTLNVRLVPFGKNQHLLLARDISHLQRLERMREEFVANVSHELRTPLTVINGYLETLTDPEENRDLPPVLRRSLEQMHGQAVRMQRLVDDLLQLSRLESRPPVAEGEPVSVTSLLRSVFEEGEILARARHQEIRLEITRDDHILGEAGELHSAFANLVSNAVRYTPEGGHIVLRWYRDATGGHFEVEDDGIGIAPRHLRRLTERFYRVDQDRSRETGGTGLGLAIVKHVLQRHGASLHIASQPGKGSVFRCDFPADRLLHDDAPRLAVTKGS